LATISWCETHPEARKAAATKATGLRLILPSRTRA
jgi:hypothetical protein